MAGTKELLKLTFVGFLLFVLVVAFYGCSSTVYAPPPLALAQMRFRPGDTGPSSQTCMKYSGDKCAQMQREVYDLTDPLIRARLRDAKVFCFAFAKRYHVCEKQPGLCHTYEKVDRILGIPTKRTIVIDEIILVPARYQSLVDANTHCAAIGSPSYDDLVTQK